MEWIDTLDELPKEAGRYLCAYVNNACKDGFEYYALTYKPNRWIGDDGEVWNPPVFWSEIKKVKLARRFIMSKIDDYKGRKRDQDYLENYLATSKPEKSDWATGGGFNFVKFARTEKGSCMLLAKFLARACDEKEAELHARAVELSRMELEAFHKEAQDEAIQFLKGGV